MKDAAEPRNHVHGIVGALHSVHAEPGPGIGECRFARGVHRQTDVDGAARAPEKNRFG